MKDKKYENLTHGEYDRYPDGQTNSVPGINTPEISPPPFNPPVPNRAWTAMCEEIKKNHNTK